MAEEIPCVDLFSLQKCDPEGVSFRRDHDLTYHSEKGLKGDLYLPTGQGPRAGRAGCSCT